MDRFTGCRFPLEATMGVQWSYLLWFEGFLTRETMAFSGLLERTASSILSRYLGAYVVGLESENWQISVASGLVELHNLRLKKTALDDVDLPIKVIAGSLGHLRLKIPWTVTIL